MSLKDVLSAIDSEIVRLEQVRALLTGDGTSTYKHGRKPATQKAASKKAPAKRVLSPEARARIAAAQKARWATQKKAMNK